MLPGIAAEKLSQISYPLRRVCQLSTELPMADSPRTIPRSRGKIAAGASAIAIAVGALVLAGWQLDIVALKSVSPTWETMKVNTALCFVLAGLSLWLQCPPGPTPLRRRAGVLAAVVILLIGILTLGESAFNIDLGIDQLVMRQAAGVAGTVAAGRMSPATAVNFILLGAALVGLNWQTRRGGRPTPPLAMTSAAVGLVAVAGYLFGVTNLYAISAYASMAVHTALLFLVVSIGVLGAQPGTLDVLTGEGLGVEFARRVLPLAVAVPVGLGALGVLGQHAGLYRFEFGAALIATTTTAAFLMLVWTAAVWLQKADAARYALIDSLRAEIERRKALEQQRADAVGRKAQLAALVRHSQEFIGIATLDGRVDFINEVARNLMGMSPNHPVEGMSIADFVHPKEHQRLALEILPEVLTGGRWSGELDFRRYSDGAAVPMLVEAFRIDDDDGHPRWIANVSLDITERKLAEAKLQASESRLRTIIETEPDCVKIIRQDGTLLEMNVSGLAMLEVASVDAARAHGLMNFICAEYRTAFAALHRRVIDGERGKMEFEVVGLNGTRRWLHTTAAPMWDEALSEKVLVGITSDITARKGLELRMMTEAARSQLFLRTASDGVHIQNGSGELVEVSDSFCRMLGYEREEMIGMNPSHWDALLNKQELRAASFALKSGNLKRFNTLHRRKDGSVFPVEIHTERFDIDGEHYVYCSSRDMSDQRSLEQALLHAVTTEQQKLGRDVHDGLGQELTGISMLAAGIAVSLKKAGRPEANELDTVANLARQAVENCRAIAHGLSPAVFAGGGLIELLQELVTLQRSSFGTDARCEVIQGGPLRLESEAVEHLYRIVQEAVANARRHGQARSIHITLNIQPATVRLEVLDDGVGFQSPTTTSTGMGLKIMQVRAAMIAARLT
ncbi:MAG: PAS domain-containing sensor histidine kinase, partial [Steroidobacteraceae bacterium]